jgi:hypothetical protein
MRNVREIITATFTVLAVTLGMLVVIPAAVIAVWLTDRNYPVDHVQGRFAGWESTSPPVARIRWAGSRNRICLGLATGWIFSDKVVTIPPKTLPPPDAHESVGKGQVVWIESTPIPPEAMETAEPEILLNVRFTWECNPIQQYWPVIIDPPPISIPVLKEPPPPGRHR